MAIVCPVLRKPEFGSPEGATAKSNAPVPSDAAPKNESQKPVVPTVPSPRA